jgi:hypothetical protein
VGAQDPSKSYQQLMFSSGHQSKRSPSKTLLNFYLLIEQLLFAQKALAYYFS